MIIILCLCSRPGIIIFDNEGDADDNDDNDDDEDDDYHRKTSKVLLKQ
jgi:hypothetical protein